MFRSRVLSAVLIAMFLFMGQITLIPAEAEAAAPFVAWAGYYAAVAYGPGALKVLGALAIGVVGSVAGSYIYDAITDPDDSSDDDSSRGTSGHSYSGSGYCPNGHYYDGSHYCYSSD